MDQQSVILKLRRRINGTTQKAVAEEMKVTQAYLSDVIQGRRDPGPRILTALGLEKHITYRPLRGSADER